MKEKGPNEKYFGIKEKTKEKEENYERKKNKERFGRKKRK